MKTDRTARLPLGPALEFLERLWQLNHAMEQLSRRMDKRLGVTGPQRLLMRCIGTQPSISAGALADLLHVDPGTISAGLKRLETKGLVERRRDPSDKRRTVLALTPKGEQLVATREGTIEHAVEALLGGAKAGEVDVTMKLVADLTERVSRELG